MDDPDAPLHLLTPAMRDVMERIRRAGHPPFHTLSPAAARAAFRVGAEVLDLPRAPLARVQDLRIPARDGHLLPARLYAAAAGRLPVLLYCHGGGFTIGGLDTHDSLCRQLALHSGAALLSLDYRLAPEHRFPTAVHDAWDALQWLAADTTLGLDTARLAVGGDSAGGTLAAVCALLARDAGLPLALQLLIYPGTAARFDSASHQRFRHGPLLDQATIDWFFGHYLAPGQRDDWRFAPLQAPDHEGVAPAWIGLAECDPLVDEGIAYGDALRAAGVAVQLELWRGVVHDFVKMGRAVPEALAAHASAGLALRQAFDACAKGLSVTTGTWAELGAEARALRQVVFIDEQGIAPQDEWDEADATALHAVARAPHGVAVATGRLLQHPSGVARIGRMAVLAGRRGQGAGRAVLGALMQAARARGDREVRLHAQAAVAGFYVRAGFVADGPVFDEVGIAHLPMRCTL